MIKDMSGKYLEPGDKFKIIDVDSTYMLVGHSHKDDTYKFIQLPFSNDSDIFTIPGIIFNQLMLIKS